MKKKRAFFLFRSFWLRLMFFFVLAMVFAGATSNFLIYRYALNSQFEQLREKLMNIAQASVAAVDVRELLSIPLNKEGANSTQYKAIVEKLAKIKNSIPTIKYIYILTRTEKPGILKFMLDVDTESADDVSEVTYPGDEYDAGRFPELLKGFEAPAADRKLAADKWGVFLSGYAPIRDADNKVIAVLGVDMTAADVQNVQKEVGRRALFVFLLGLVLALALGSFISGGVYRQIAELIKGVSHFAQGDLDYKVSVKGADEIAQLGNTFNKMSEDLKVYVKELQNTTAEKERLLKELEIARGIQQSFLPDFTPQMQKFDIAAMNLPARIVGGDFYDFIPIQKDKWGLVIADVSGKGVPAALFMALSRALIRASASITLSPADAVRHANKLIMEDNKSSMFVTLFYAMLDAQTRVLKYSNAGHNPPFIMSGAARDLVFLKAQTMPLGIMPDIEVVNEEIILNQGDIVLLYTDGVTEAVNGEMERFEMERLEEVVQKNRQLSAQEIIDKIEKKLTYFVGGQPQFDDITMIVIKAE